MDEQDLNTEDMRGVVATKLRRGELDYRFYKQVMVPGPCYFCGRHVESQGYHAIMPDPDNEDDTFLFRFDVSCLNRAINGELERSVDN